MRKIILSIIAFICLAKNNALGQYWSALGPGLGETFNAPTVHALLLHNGELYAGGYFDVAGGQPANNIAKWNGSYWSALGSGIENFGVHCLSIYNGEIYAGGNFSIAGGLNLIGLAKWDGNSWSPVGNSLEYGAVHAMVVHDGSLYIAGHFTEVGGIAAKNIARWNGTNWSSLGSGINGTVYSLEFYNGSLFAGGGFTAAGNNSASNIAKWDGNSWSSPGAGFDGLVYTLSTYDNALYAGGGFLSSGNVATKFVARWNGNTWSAIGSGMSDPVFSLNSFGNYLYAGGGFDMADTISVNGIAKWNGNTWSGLGEGTGHAHAITADSSAVYAAGSFMMAGNATVNAVAKWTEQCISVPTQPGIITGDSTVCAGSSQTYSIAPVTDAASYMWTLPAGWTGTSNTNAISCIAGTNGGVITVVARNTCGNSIIQSFHVDVSDLIPVQPGVIIGNDSVCYGSTETYFTDPAPGITSYTWSLPYDWQGSSTTSSITAIVGEWSGEITVIAHNDYCSSNPQTLFVTINYFFPSQPDVINGNNSVCSGSTQTYFVNHLPGSISYSWNIPQGWSGNSTTDSITVTVGSNPGIILVVANNNCGSSFAQTLEVTIDSLPLQPSLITGSDSVCQLTSQLYSVSPVNGTTSYTWNLPAGWSGISNSNSITVQAGLNSGSISVIANNNCGASVPRTMLITTESTPTMPALINGNDTVCEGSAQTYFIDPVPGAIGYAWDLTFGSAFGFDSTTITITALHSGYPDDFITVSAYNNCGNSDMLALPVKVNHLPYQPNRIFGSNLVCRGSNQTYFIDTVPGATSYTWVIPSGWIGNSNTSSINVDVGNEIGEILVSANNSCGNGSFKSLQILFDTIPPKPGPINGNAYVSTGEKHAYSVDITNRPSGYKWSLSGGGNLTAGQSPQKIEIDWQTPGNYVLSVNAVNSCGVSTEQKMNITVSGANEKDPYSLQLYPNPSTGQFFLKAKRIQDKLINVAVLNMAGQLVFRSGKRQGTNDYSQLINLDKMAIGLYAVTIMIDDKTYVRTVMINH